MAFSAAGGLDGRLAALGKQSARLHQSLAGGKLDTPSARIQYHFNHGTNHC
jgi:hypothetical protein